MSSQQEFVSHMANATYLRLWLPTIATYSEPKHLRPWPADLPTPPSCFHSKGSSGDTPRHSIDTAHPSATGGHSTGLRHSDARPTVASRWDRHHDIYASTSGPRRAFRAQAGGAQFRRPSSRECTRSLRLWAPMVAGAWQMAEFNR